MTMQLTRLEHTRAPRSREVVEVSVPSLAEFVDTPYTRWTMRDCPSRAALLQCVDRCTAR
jgi:hypothetical protein